MKQREMKQRMENECLDLVALYIRAVGGLISRCVEEVGGDLDGC